jgi:putative glutamine amidotransferase
MALAKETPLLAICRGLQVINVAAGGTLIQDLPSQMNQSLGHHVDTPSFALAHEVWVTPGSALSRVMQEELADGEVLQVNSRHHQAVDRPAAGFSVAATAPDGVVEAIERRDAPFCIAVQWHPENFWRTGEFRSLFEEFVKAADAGQ